MILVGVYLVLAALFFGGWYWFSLRYTRHKAVRVLRWIEAALVNQGHATGMHWLDSSRFKVPLRLNSGVFHCAWMIVQLSPCETPMNWILGKLLGRQDVIIFQADLDWAPMFSLDVHNFRWFARSSRKSSPADSRWTFEQTGPFVITTRMDWQKEIVSAMTSLAGMTGKEFLNINFSHHSPHFSVTMPLGTIAPANPTRTWMFEAVREVATSALPSLY